MKKLMLIGLTSFIFLVNLFPLVGNESSKNDFNQSRSDDYFIGNKIYSSSECYEIQEVLGEGAFGKVYAVENSKGEKFALKCYKFDQWLSSYNKDYMNPYIDSQREFQRGQILDHPNIIKSIEFFEYTTSEGDATQNLILQYVEGKTIGDVVRASLSRDEGISALLQVYSALSYALSVGYMHLDLHSYNVMLSNEADVMVIDLASFFSSAEIFNFVRQTTYASTSKSHLITQKLAHIGTQKQTATKNVKVVEEKLQRFFLHHPDLFNKIQQIQQSEKFKKPNYLMALSSEQESNIDLSLIENLFGGYYLDSITDLCINILNKSTIARDERMNLRITLKKIFWNCQEDLDEGKVLPIRSYLDQICEIQVKY